LEEAADRRLRADDGGSMIAIGAEY